MLDCFSRVRKYLHIMSVIVILLTMHGCASYTKWKVDAVEPSRKGVAPNSLNVGNFSSRSRNESTTFSALLSGMLQKEGFIEIQQKGAEGSISGTLNWGKTKHDTWSDSYKYKGKTRKLYYAKVQKSLTVSYKLNIGGKTYSSTYEKRFKKKESSSNSYSEAKADLPSEDSIKSYLMQQAASEIVRDITPYKARRTYKIKLGGSDNLSLGADYLKINRQDQAMEIFRQIANKTNNDEDRAAAIYNQGVIHEARGDFEKAFKAYRDASQLHLEEMMYPKAISRLERENKDRLQLNKQMESFNR